MRLGVIGAACCFVLVGCNPFSRSGALRAEWVAVGDTLGDTTRVTLPVTATWCAGPSRLDIRATVGDTGLGLTIYPSDSAALAGEYPIREPDPRVTVRPGAAVAVRWMGKVLIQGWWGDSGTVTLAGGRVRGLSGEGTASLISGLGRDSVTALAFEFSGARVRTDTLCDAPPPPPTDSSGTLPDAGVD